MRLTCGLFVAFVILGSAAQAQTATVGIFPSSATNPNVAAPVAAPVVYTPICGITPKAVEILPITNPTTGAYDDPANPTTRDCRVTVTPQVSTLANGTYKAALKIGSGAYGGFSSAFAMAAAQVDVCAGTPPASGTGPTGAKTITFCNASAQITGWALYTNGVRSVPTGVSGPTITPTSRAYTLIVTAPTGATTYEIAGINSAAAVPEGSKSPAFVYTGQVPPQTPTGTSIRSVQ